MQTVPASVIEWTATKNSDVSVEGTIGLSGMIGGVVVNEKSNSIVIPDLSIVFDLNSLNTNEPVRDQRIQNYIFGLDKNLTFSFESKAVSVNDPSSFSLGGSLTIAGKMIPFSLPLTMTISENVVTLSITDEAGFPVDLREDLELDEQIEALLQLVPGTTLLNETMISFNVTFQPC